jgi:hypothetical protein
MCRPIAAAALTDANERMLQALDVSNGNMLTLCVPAKSVRTLMITF